MKKYLLLLILVAASTAVWSQSFKKKYEDKLEPNSKLIESGFNYTFEKVNDTLYIYKQYFTENRQITEYRSYNNKKLSIKNGLFMSMYDDGTLISKGYYQKDKKEGLWLEGIENYGNYKNGKKKGRWQAIRADSTVHKEMYFLNDKLHGKRIQFDSLGNTTKVEQYLRGELLSQSIDTTLKIAEEMPRFPGCENPSLNLEQLTKCANNKLLNYIYSNLKYPSKAREYEVEGSAIFQFDIDKDGNIVDVIALRGISGDIKKECLRLINDMPKWRPGYQDGKPVKVRYTLPVVFKLV